MSKLTQKGPKNEANHDEANHDKDPDRRTLTGQASFAETASWFSLAELGGRDARAPGTLSAYCLLRTAFFPCPWPIGASHPAPWCD
jgi:hypothetical protein